jgi:hypothetical protein
MSSELPDTGFTRGSPPSSTHSTSETLEAWPCAFVQVSVSLRCPSDEKGTGRSVSHSRRGWAGDWPLFMHLRSRSVVCPAASSRPSTATRPPAARSRLQLIAPNCPQWRRFGCSGRPHQPQRSPPTSPRRRDADQNGADGDHGHIGEARNRRSGRYRCVGLRPGRRYSGGVSVVVAFQHPRIVRRGQPESVEGWAARRAPRTTPASSPGRCGDRSGAHSSPCRHVTHGYVLPRAPAKSRLVSGLS